MVDQSRRDRVGLGLIGLGPSWEQIYREPLLRLQNRLTIRLVYDAVEVRSKSVAGELNASQVGSLRQILTRHTLQGLLVLDPGWCGPGALSLIARSGKPVFLATPVLRHTSALVSTLTASTNQIASDGQSAKAYDHLMPELKFRFTPASCRLRELMATKLGPAKQIEIDGNLNAEIEETAALVDWCIDIMGKLPTATSRATNLSAVGPRFELEFPPRSSSISSASTKRTATLRQHSVADNPVRIEIECERGRATLFNRTHIVWRTSSDSADESLTDERTETEILIDQFCRRALGGLNPIGRLSEFARAIEIVRSIQNDPI